MRNREGELRIGGQSNVCDTTLSERCHFKLKLLLPPSGLCGSDIKPCADVSAGKQPVLLQDRVCRAGGGCAILCHPLGWAGPPTSPKRVHVSCASSHSMQGVPCCVCPISFTGVNWDLSVLLGWNTALVVVTKSWVQMSGVTAVPTVICAQGQGMDGGPCWVSPDCFCAL